MQKEPAPYPPDGSAPPSPTSAQGKRALIGGALPLLLTLLALIAVLLLAAFRPAQRRNAPQVGTLPRPTASATASLTPSLTRTPSATATPTATSTPTVTPLSPIIYVVVAGDSAAAISEKFGVSIESIIETNGLDKAGTMHPGDKLRIPYPTPTPAPTTPAPTGARSPGSTSAGSLTPFPRPGSPSPTSSPHPLVHELAKGETLEAVAARYGVTVEALTKANQIANPSALQAGQKLVIPGRLVTATPLPTSAPTATHTPGPRYPAPHLLSPADGAPYRGADAVIVLQWASVALLADDEWYELTLESPTGLVSAIRTKATSWRMPSTMRPFPDADAHTFTWSVEVAGGKQEEGSSLRLSAVAAKRKFLWD